MTKAEKLQIVNLAPTKAVELYVVCLRLRSHLHKVLNLSFSQIVEELEDRLGDSMDDLLTCVDSSLGAPAAPPTTGAEMFSLVEHSDESSYLHSSLLDDTYYPDANDVYQEEIVFDDVGEGVGIEGDLDVEDD